MGMVKCPVHALQFALTCCPHIADAVDEARAEPGTVLVDMWDQATVLCDACRDRLVPQIATSPRWGMPDLAFDPPLTVHCEVHVAEWFARTGQGELSEAIGHTKAGGET